MNEKRIKITVLKFPIFLKNKSGTKKQMESDMIALLTTIGYFFIVIQNSGKYNNENLDFVIESEVKSISNLYIKNCCSYSKIVSSYSRVAVKGSLIKYCC
jgi:hypothetical protein